MQTVCQFQYLFLFNNTDIMIFIRIAMANIIR